MAAIKVVHSYGGEELENNNYKKYLNKAAAVQGKLAVNTSLGLSLVYLIMFGFYAYAFYFGGMLRWSKEEWMINDLTGKRYTGGEIMGIMFSVLFGIF